MKKYQVGAVIRGDYVEDNLISFGGRNADIEFLAPDPQTLLPRLPLSNPVKMLELYQLSFDDILDYLDQLGDKLNLDTNEYMQEALEASCLTSGLTLPLLRSSYKNMQQLFKRDCVREMVEQRIGIDHLEGWVAQTLRDGRTLSIRAFGARALHIIAGNAPQIAGLSIIRNAITRSDAIIKTPSNDPFTALAIARTMLDMAPDHPLTRHLTVAYWKGGDQSLEDKLYQAHNLEKVIAWGGLASVKHITQYIQPGLELITLDPKRSVSIIGPEAFADDVTQQQVATHLAADVGSFNQEACVNARVVYVLSGTDDDGLAKVNRFGQQLYDALLALPESVSTKPKTFNTELKANITAVSLNDEWYNVIGGDDNEGAVIVSQLPEPVEFAASLANRVANLVPVDTIDEVFAAVDSYTQTVGIYPESLKSALRDQLPLFGAQRLTSLGYSAQGAVAAPQDAIEPLRRMCKWIIDETCDPEIVTPVWEAVADTKSQG